MNAHRMLLANASHECARRCRASGSASTCFSTTRLQAEVERKHRELDQMIDESCCASRAWRRSRNRTGRSVESLALAAEGRAFTTLHGRRRSGNSARDRRLLGRMIRTCSTMPGHGAPRCASRSAANARAVVESDGRRQACRRPSGKKKRVFTPFYGWPRHRGRRPGPGPGPADRPAAWRRRAVAPKSGFPSALRSACLTKRRRFRS